MLGTEGPPNSGIPPDAASRVRSRKTVPNEKKSAAQSIGSSALYALNDLDERLAGSKPSHMIYQLRVGLLVQPLYVRRQAGFSHRENPG